MSKKKNGNFLQLSRRLFNNEKFQKLSNNAKWLYVVLNELEHRYTGEKENFFFRSNEELVRDTGLSLRVLIRAKRELKGIVQIWPIHFVDPETKKKSQKHITAYRILE